MSEKTTVTTATAATATEEKDEKKEKKIFRLVNSNPAKLNATICTVYMESSKITDIINDIFRPAFADYWGCTLTIDPQIGVPQISLIFRHRDDVADNVIQGTVNLTQGNGEAEVKNSIKAGIRILSNTNSYKRIYDLSQAGKEAIEPFMISDLKNNFIFGNKNNLVASTTKGKINENDRTKWWDAHTRQIDTPDAGKLLYVDHVSIDNIMEFYFGTVIDGEAMQYKVALVRALDGITNNFGIIIGTNAMYAVHIANASEISRLCNTVTTPMPINTPTASIVRA